ncbi:Pr6Pr family membrane protein [Spiroplasma endosymbiont of Acasis viretata]|uniref:Pr6Pr family membrane protein n=1 Tax=Spiroplasma endosymbiont of Acasis viretata TaxID=3066306 RepID=UPI00313C26B8
MDLSWYDCIKDWKFYFKLGFGLFFLAVLLYGLLSPLINGITVTDQQKKDARNWMWFTEDKGDFILNYFSFFTIQTNVFVIIWLISSAIFWEQEGRINSKWFGQYMTLAVTTFITITGIVFNVMLLPTLVNQLQTFYAWFTNIVQHIVVPIIMIIYFFIMPREQGSVFTTKEFWKKRMWMYYIYPVIWAVIMLIRGEFRWQAGKVWAYQYFF